MKLKACHQYLILAIIRKIIPSTKDIESVEIIIIISNKRQHHRMRKEVIYRDSGEP
jgi:hypothetical protein